jgi:hypothetical protein
LFGAVGADAIIPRWLGQFRRELKPMFKSVTESSEARMALYFVSVAMLGSIIMALVSNFAR